jgi:AraC-like DNA-binding protein
MNTFTWNAIFQDPAAHCPKSDGLSRSALYRLFERDGGVANYIRNLRLDRCFADLLDSPPKRGCVCRIAQNWSFFDPANFNRAFRNRFGVAPSDCVISHDVGTAWSNSLPEHPVHDWMTDPRRT